MRYITLGFWSFLVVFILSSCGERNKLFTHYGPGGNKTDLHFYSEGGYKYINMPIVFETGQKQLTNPMKDKLDGLAEYLNSNGSVMLDISPTEKKLVDTATGKSIGLVRSEMVKEYLIGQGVDMWRMAAKECDSAENESVLVNRLKFKILPYEHRIRPDDKVSVSIWNHPDLSVGSIFGVYNVNEVTRKWVLVDGDGFVTLPQIGKINLMGMTVKEANKLITDFHKKNIVDPQVVVQILNRDVTLLGEVKIPGSMKLEKERNTLVEVIGRAGGLTYHADRTQIQIIRGKGGDQKEIYVDLTDINTLRNQDLIVQSGDVIHVMPIISKKYEKRAGMILPYASIVSSLVLTWSIIFNSN